MRKLLVTGSLGLIGSEGCFHFANLGWELHGVDNNQRAVFFGVQGGIRWNQRRLKSCLKEFVRHGIDIHDLARKLKNWVYSRSNLVIVAPSEWLTEQAKQSLLSHFPIHHIPYGIDTDAYQPLDSKECKLLLGISLSKTVLMFGAETLKDPRKGGKILMTTLQNLPKAIKAETVLLTLGDGAEMISESVGIPTINLGYVSSDRLKSIAFSAADLFLFPTRADNLPLVLQESMACGTPIVSFRIGGVPDLVRPGVTGYLAEPENDRDFCKGIVQLLEDQDLRDHMSQQCRTISLNEYPLELQAQRYVELYHQVLQDGR